MTSIRRRGSVALGAILLVSGLLLAIELARPKGNSKGGVVFHRADSALVVGGSTLLLPLDSATTPKLGEKELVEKLRAKPFDYKPVATSSKVDAWLGIIQPPSRSPGNAALHPTVVSRPNARFGRDVGTLVYVLVGDANMPCLYPGGLVVPRSDSTPTPQPTLAIGSCSWAMVVGADTGENFFVIQSADRRPVQPYQ